MILEADLDGDGQVLDKYMHTSAEALFLDVAMAAMSPKRESTVYLYLDICIIYISILVDTTNSRLDSHWGGHGTHRYVQKWGLRV